MGNLTKNHKMICDTINALIFNRFEAYVKQYITSSNSTEIAESLIETCKIITNPKIVDSDYKSKYIYKPIQSIDNSSIYNNIDELVNHYLVLSKEEYEEDNDVNVLNCIGEINKSIVNLKSQLSRINGFTGSKFSFEPDIIVEILYAMNELKFSQRNSFYIRTDNLGIFHNEHRDDLFKHEDKELMNIGVGYTNIPKFVELFCKRTIFTEACNYIIDNANIEEGGCTKYIVYGLRDSNKYATYEKALSINSIQVTSNQIIVSSFHIISELCHEFELTRSIIKRDENGNVTIGNVFWENPNVSVLDAARAMFDIINVFATIYEYIDRKCVEVAPSKEYHYTLEHLPTAIYNKDGNLVYNKYTDHISENPFYPTNRKSPRRHHVRTFTRKNGTVVQGYMRGSDNYMSYDDNREDIKEDNNMAKFLNCKQRDAIIPELIEELKNIKSVKNTKGAVKQIANRYKVPYDFVMHIKNSRHISIGSNNKESNVVEDTINNEELILSATEVVSDDEPVQKVELKKSKSKSKITPEEEKEIRDANAAGMTISDIVELTGRSETAIRKIIGGVKYKISDDKIENVFKLKAKGYTNVAIANEMNISDTYVSNILKDPKLIEKMTNQESTTEEVILSEEDTTVSNPIVIYNSEYNVKPISTTELNVALVRERHEYGNISLYIFNSMSTELMFNYKAQLEICEKFIDDNVEFVNGKATNSLVVWCSGLQCALASIIKACYNKKVNLTLKHHNSTINSYYNQVIFDDFPGKSVSTNIDFANVFRNFGGVYTYNCDYRELKENQTLYSVIINKGTTKDHKYNHFIITDTEDKVWKLIQKSIKNIKANKHIKLGIVSSEFEIQKSKIVWNDQIASSRNFK